MSIFLGDSTYDKNKLLTTYISAPIQFGYDYKLKNKKTIGGFMGMKKFIILELEKYRVYMAIARVSDFIELILRRKILISLMRP